MYKKMYLTLFNAITDALGLIEEKKIIEATALLKRAQQSTEEQYITGAEGAPHPSKRSPWTAEHFQ